MAGAVAALGLVLAVLSPGFFARDNLIDLFLANMPVLIIALGMTLVILTGHIDISVGSLFAVCAVSSGVLAKAGLPMPMVVLATCAIGVLLGDGERIARGLPADSLDRRHPRHDDCVAGRPAMGDPGRVDAGSAGRVISGSGMSPAAYPVVAFMAVALLQIGFGWGTAQPGGGARRVCDRLEPSAARLAGLRVEVDHRRRVRDRRRAGRARRAC